MSDQPIPSPQEPQQKGFVSAFRTTVLYALPGPDTLSIIAAMGFGQPQSFTAEEADILTKMVTLGRALAGDTNPVQLPISGFISQDGQRRLMAVWTTVPSMIVAQIGPAVGRFSALKGPQGQSLVTPGQAPKPDEPSQNN